MEIRRWHLYIIVNCVLIYCVVAKPFSLNEAIAAESQQTPAVRTTPSPKLKEPATERYHLDKALSPISRKSKKVEETGSIIVLDKKISPLKYRKTFQIKSPLKPKKIKYSLKPRYKRKNQSVKREINGNEKLNQKYIPLLKNLDMLFDNLISTASSESHEIKTSKYKRNFAEDNNEVVCKCASKFNSESRSQEKADTPATDLTTGVPILTEVLSSIEATSTPTDNTTISDISSFRQYTNVPVLLPRNTFSSRGDNNGFNEGSGTAYNRSIERNITRHNGYSEHDTGCRDESDTESNEENTYGTSRDDTSGVERRRGVRGHRYVARNSNYGFATDETYNVSKGENEITVDDVKRNTNEPKGNDKLKTGRDENESAKSLPEFIRGLRQFELEDKAIHNAESIPPKASHKESDLNVTYDNTSYQRIVDTDGTPPSKDQKVRPGNETINRKKISSSTSVPQEISKGKSPVVVIIDGYSLTRDKNGENKLSEKAIRIHSK